MAGLRLIEKGVILNLLKTRKEFGMKIALTRVASSESRAPSDNGRAQDGERQKKKRRFLCLRQS
jgi:hypothetical protein